MSAERTRTAAESLAGLLGTDEDAWVALIACVPVDDAGQVAAALMRMFGALGKDNEVVKYCIMRQVIDTEDPVQLFRGSCIHNAVIAHSALLHGREWVQSVVAPVLTKFVHRPIAAGASFEVDPVRAGSEEAAERNVQNLKGAANHVIAALLENVDSLPVYAPVPLAIPCDDRAYFCCPSPVAGKFPHKHCDRFEKRVLSPDIPNRAIEASKSGPGLTPLSAVRRTYAFAQQHAAAKFPQHEFLAAPSLFFLRLLCPALVAPEEYCLFKTRPSEPAMRAHVLLAKLLQSVANEVPPFGKEEYMQPLNRWVEAAVPSVRRFFKIALVRVCHTGDGVDILALSVSEGGVVAGESSTPLSERRCKLYAIPNPGADADTRFLGTYVRLMSDRFRAQLATQRAHKTLLACEAYLLPSMTSGALDAPPSGVRRHNSYEAPTTPRVPQSLSTGAVSTSRKSSGKRRVLNTRRDAATGSTVAQAS